MKGQTMNRYDFYKLAAEIADWHTVTFPDADEAGQQAKYDEECKEYDESNGDIMELADCFIVASALAFRFGSVFGFEMLTRIIEKNADELYDAIKSKMEINRKRTWHKQKTGSYHHVDER